MGDCIILNRRTSFEGNGFPVYTYSSSTAHEFIDDGDGNWRIKLLSGGTLRFSSLGNAKNGIDVFLVGGGGAGGGGAGGNANYTDYCSGVAGTDGLGGGGGGNWGKGSSGKGGSGIVIIRNKR